MPDRALQLLRTWLDRQLPDSGRSWLAEQLDRVAADPSLRNLQIAFGMVPRKLGKLDLELNDADLAQAAEARPGWQPQSWSVDMAARVLIITTAGRASNEFHRSFVNLCRHADVAEAVALYSGLPLYPEQQALEPQVGEGLRTNMRAIFEAIAHNNPYPKEHFDENRWNHMVLKALFVESSLYPIQGLDQRANPELARILRDYAHERWAASRPVTPELWRCIGPFTDGEVLTDLDRLVSSSNALEKQAAALALNASSSEQAKLRLSSMSAETMAIANGQLSWDQVGLDHANSTK
ncbi:MAG: EboA domain-containing protein [Hyphomicrobiaceae bacterium]